MDEWRIVPRKPEHTKILSGWKYDGEYAFYNPSETEDAEPPDGSEFFVCVDGGGEIVGHVSYGTDGQIGTLEQYIYSDEYLDIGIGLRPDLCGRGLGASFVRLCMDFAREKYGQEKFRLSVAAFNERAVKVYKKLGFSIEREVTNSFFGNPFYIMTFSISDKK